MVPNAVENIELVHLEHEIKHSVFFSDQKKDNHYEHESKRERERERGRVVDLKSYAENNLCKQGHLRWHICFLVYDNLRTILSSM